MTDRKQFEAMLEALINEDTEQAKEIFHNIVVAKSREIYEELLSEDFEEEEAVEEEAEEEEAAVEEEMEDEAAVEGFGEEEGEEESDDEEGGDDVGGDATDDMIGDVDADADGEEEMDDNEQTDRILDLEDALEELKAEFEQLMAGEEGEGHHDDMGGMDDMGGDDMGGMDAEPEIDELQTMMEYVNKVGGATYDKFGKMGDDGVNNKSIVAGKNDMGGTAKNIAQGFSTEKGGTEGGLASPKAGDLTAGLGNIHNRKDSKAGKTAFTKKEPGHGAEKKGAAEKADNKTSMINGAPGRAK
jgi:hypothetical protein